MLISITLNFTLWALKRIVRLFCWGSKWNVKNYLNVLYWIGPRLCLKISNLISMQPTFSNLWSIRIGHYLISWLWHGIEKMSKWKAQRIFYSKFIDSWWSGYWDLDKQYKAKNFYVRGWLAELPILQYMKLSACKTTDNIIDEVNYKWFNTRGCSLHCLSRIVALESYLLAVLILYTSDYLARLFHHRTLTSEKLDISWSIMKY